jgi:hypothetical protein
MVARSVLSAVLGSVLTSLVLSSLVACSGEDGPPGEKGAAGTEGAPGQAGEKGDPGEKGDEGAEARGSAATVSGVLPARIHRERVIDVVVTGDNTSWTDEVEVDLGDDVEIFSLVVASPTSLRVSLRADGSATTGERDVRVVEGEEELVFAGAFRVEPAFEIDAPDELPQGGIVPLRGHMRDTSTPLDTTEVASEFPHVSLASEDLSFVVEEVRPFELGALALVDVLAATGGRSVIVASGGDEPLESTAQEAFTLVAREPAELEDGEESTIAEPFGTALYVYQPPDEVTLVTIAIATDETAAAPGFALLPASGSYAELIDFDDVTTFVTDGSGDPYYVVVFDNLGAFDYPFEISIDEEAAPDAVEQEPNDACADADAIAVGEPVLASLADGTDVDVFELEATLEDTGQIVHVVTSAGDPTTDTVVEVLRADCTTSMGGQSLDADYHEDHRSTPIAAAGPIFVRVTSSSFGWNQPDYLLTVTFEDP